MNRKIEYYIDILILYMVLFFLIVDSINGIVIRYDLPSISQPYKLFLILLMFVRILTNSIVDGTLMLWLSGVFLFPVIYTFLHTGGNLSYLREDIAVFLRVIYIFISFFYFKNVFFLKFHEKGHMFFIRIVKFSYFVIVLNLLLGIVGIGYEQYAGGIGTTGFFYAGNELSGLMTIFHCILLFWFYSKISGFKYLLLILLVLAMSLLKATKVGIMGTFLTICAVGFFYNSFSIRFIKLKSIKLGFQIALLSLILVYFTYFAIEESGLLDRMMWLYNNMNGDIITLLFSERNIFVRYGLIQFMDFNIVELLFGIGSKASQNMMIPYMGAPKTMEIDFFDILFNHGLIGVSIVYTSIIWLCIISFRFYFKTKHQKYSMLGFCNLMILLVSLTGGHVLNGGMVTLFIGLINGFVLSNRPKLEKQ